MQIVSLQVIDAGEDILLVHGVVDTDATRVFEARGWLSATTNHYDAPLNEDGHRSAKATPRAMTSQEMRAYFLGLLSEQNPELVDLREQPERRVLHEENPEILATARMGGPPVDASDSAS